MTETTFNLRIGSKVSLKCPCIFPLGSKNPEKITKTHWIIELRFFLGDKEYAFIRPDSPAYGYGRSMIPIDQLV